MSFRKAYLVIMLILGVSYLMGSSLAAPVLQRADDEGDSSDPPPPDPVQKGMSDVSPPAITSTPVQVNIATTTTATSPTPTPTGSDSEVEIVPPVTILKQLGTSAIVVASDGKTSTIGISPSGLPNSTSNNPNQVTNAGTGLKISSSVIAVSLVVGVWILFWNW